MAEDNRYRRYEPLFGSWYIKEQIGRGAIGQVYEIERNDLDTTYRAALKAITIPEGPEDIKRVLSSGVAEEDLADYYRKLIRKIANEFQYLAKLKGNSYIVNYEDHQIIENIDEMRWDVLIKTELLRPLVEEEIEHPLGEQDVLRLGMDICRALKYCGQYNILHRDIKPENIFIAPSGDYKLGDFGIARVVEETYVNLSRKGTYTYMAPEVFHGQKYGQQADLYSLGLVMYKLLNHGRIPFMPSYPAKIEFDDAEKAFTERMSGNSLPEPQTGSAKLRRIVMKACAYDVDDRYESAEEMLEDLEELYLAANRKKRSRKKKVSSAKVKSSAAKAAAASGTPVENVPVPAIQAKTEPAAGSSRDNTPTPETQTETTPAASTNTGDNKSSGKKKRSVGIVLAVLLLAAAGAYAAIPKEVTDIKGIDPEIQLYYDGSVQPEYVIEPDWFKDEPITFASSDEKVFRVSADGEITAASIGEADLTMKAKEYTETVHVSIVPKVTAIGGIDSGYSLVTGNTVQLEPALEPKEFAGEKVTYSSSDESIASVNESGLITANAAGEAEITISAGGSSTTTKVTVTAPVIRKSTTSSGSRSKKSSGSKSKSSKSKSSGSSKESFGDEEYF